MAFTVFHQRISSLHCLALNKDNNVVNELCWKNCESYFDSTFNLIKMFVSGVFANCDGEWVVGSFNNRVEFFSILHQTDQ